MVRFEDSDWADKAGSLQTMQLGANAIVIVAATHYSFVYYFCSS